MHQHWYESQYGFFGTILITAFLAVGCIGVSVVLPLLALSSVLFGWPW